MYFGKELYGDKFTIENDPVAQEIYKTVYYNFIGGKTADLLKAAPEKGIFLQGPIGVGKSSLFRIFQKMFLNTPRQFRRVTSKQIMDDAMDREKGQEWTHEFYGRYMLEDLYIDDLGIGQADMNVYGNWFNVVGDIIHERYDNWIRHGIRTHFSTNTPTTVENLSEISLENMFGSRALDRIIEMTKYIHWEGDSKRR